MNIQEQINNDIKQAMKERNTDKLSALRSAKSAIMLEATKDGSSSIPDSSCIKIITRLVKQRKDSAEIYTEQGRQDLVADEMNQLAYLEEYLPEKASEEEVRIIVSQTISEIGASSHKDIGMCMQILIKKLDGKAEGSLISKLVREELGK